MALFPQRGFLCQEFRYESGYRPNPATQGESLPVNVTSVLRLFCDHSLWVKHNDWWHVDLGQMIARLSRRRERKSPASGAGASCNGGYFIRDDPGQSTVSLMTSFSRNEDALFREVLLLVACRDDSACAHIVVECLRQHGRLVDMRYC